MRAPGPSLPVAAPASPAASLAASGRTSGMQEIARASGLRLVAGSLAPAPYPASCVDPATCTTSHPRAGVEEAEQ